MSRRVFGDGPGLKPISMGPVFGEPLYEIIIDVDKRGLMRTRLTKYPLGNPPTQLQIMGMLLDSMQGQFQGMIQSARMIVDPNKHPYPVPLNNEEQSNGGEEKENHNSSGRDSSGGNSGS